MYVYIYIQTNVHIYNIENPDLVETKDNLSGKKRQTSQNQSPEW